MSAFDFVIVGGGTAGLSAAIYACRANKTALVIERESFGGQIVNAPLVENYPGIPAISGAQFSADLYEQAKHAGAQFKSETVVAVQYGKDAHTVTTDAGKYECKNLIIAVGCKHRKLGVAREDELIGSGVSYCALCDGAFFRNATVAVVGGGNAALTDALYLADIAKTVYLIHRRDSFRAESTLVDRARSRKNIKILTDATVAELIGTDALSGIQVMQKGEGVTLDVDGLFVAVGQAPDNAIFGVTLDASGYILTDADCATNIARVYAVGDCRQKSVRQLTTAAADGAIAVSKAIR